MLLAAPAEAQEEGAATTLQGADRRLPAQGDRYVVRLQENWSATTSRTLDGDKEPMSFGRETRLQALYFLDALEVSETRVEAWAMTFTAWRWQRGSQNLTDLTSLQLVLRRKIKDRFVLDPPEAAKSLSQPAREFVERQARAFTRSDLSVFLPPRAVRVGETWKVDPGEAAAILLEDGQPRVKDSQVEGKLVSLSGQGAELRVKASLALSRLPGTDAPSKGGAWEVDTTYRWPHGLPRAASSVERRVRFSGKGRNQRPDGKGYTVELTVQGRIRARIVPADK